MSQSISTVVWTMLLLGGEGTWRLPPPDSGPQGTQRCRGSCLTTAVSSHLRRWCSRAWQSPPVPRALQRLSPACASRDRIREAEAVLSPLDRKPGKGKPILG